MERKSCPVQTPKTGGIMLRVKTQSGAEYLVTMVNGRMYCKKPHPTVGRERKCLAVSEDRLKFIPKIQNWELQDNKLIGQTENGAINFNPSLIRPGFVLADPKGFRTTPIIEIRDDL
jgi:hypothetical protein